MWLEMYKYQSVLVLICTKYWEIVMGEIFVNMVYSLQKKFSQFIFVWCSSEHSYLVLFSCDAAVNTACLWNLTMHLQLKKILTRLPTSLCRGISMRRTAAQLFFRHVSLSPLPWQKMTSVCFLYICTLCKVGQSSIDRGPSSYSKVYSLKLSVFILN